MILHHLICLCYFAFLDAFFAIRRKKEQVCPIGTEFASHLLRNFFVYRDHARDDRRPDGDCQECNEHTKFSPEQRIGDHDEVHMQSFHIHKITCRGEQWPDAG